MIEINSNRIKDIFKRFINKKILVIGDLMVDEYLSGNVSRVSPEAPVPVVDIIDQSVRFGGAANVAYNLLHLGCQPVLVGVIGQDQMGHKFLEIARENEMICDGIIQIQDRPTTVKTRIIGHSQHIVRIDKELNTYLSGNDESMVIEMIKSFISNVDAVVFQDYNKGVLTEDIINYTISAAQQNEKLITVDPKFMNFFNYRNVTVFKPNIKEIESAFAIKIKDQSDLMTTGKKLLEKINASCVLITRGEEGMSLLETNREPVHVPTRVRKVSDVSGAGDTVISAMTAAVVGGASFQEAATIANYAAGIVCEEVGIVPVNKDKLYKVCIGQNSK